MNQDQSRLEILDSLRGLAALGVALFHLTSSLPSSLLTQGCSYLWLGGRVAFVLSGFVIPYALIRSNYQFGRQYLTFLARRITRLHPPFLASVALAILLWNLSALVPGFRGTRPDISVAQVAAHAAFLNGIWNIPWLQPVYWTLALEFQYYLTVGLILPILLSSRTGFWIGNGLLLLLGLIPRIAPGDTTWIWPYLPLFVLGILVCFHELRRVSTAAFLAAWLVSTLVASQSMGLAEASAGGVTALVMAFVRTPGPRALRWLGGISYSLYLIHVPLGGRVMNLTNRIDPGSLAVQVGFTVFALILSVSCAALWFRHLEVPSRRWASAIRSRTHLFNWAVAPRRAAAE